MTKTIIKPTISIHPYRDEDTGDWRLAVEVLGDLEDVFLGRTKTKLNFVLRFGKKPLPLRQLCREVSAHLTQISKRLCT